MTAAMRTRGLGRGGSRRPARGSVLAVTLMAVTVLLVLGCSILTIAFSEDFNARREGSTLRAFFAVEAGVHEAVVRMNVNPSGASDDETELKWTAGTGNPDAVRDPRLVLGNAPDPDPTHFSDSALNSWRYWNYDPSWRYTGAAADGDGNYPGATATQQANLNTAGRAFPYNGASARTLLPGSGYTVRVLPQVRKGAGSWQFADARGVAAFPNTFYYRILATGSQLSQSATVQVLVKKFFFGPAIPATLTAGGNATIGGNASVTIGLPGDQNSSGVAVQSAGTGSATGSGIITGAVANNTPFPAFETVFGLSKADLQAKATITGSYTAANTTNPPAVPSGTAGQLIWLTASNGGVKKDLTFTGSGAGGYTLGSPTRPVLLVVDGNLVLNSVTIYGVIYVTGAFRNQGGSQIEGSILVEGTAETDVLGTGSGGGTKMAYSASVLHNLNQESEMFPVSLLKGTWQMRNG